MKVKVSYNHFQRRLSHVLDDRADLTLILLRDWFNVLLLSRRFNKRYDANTVCVNR